MALACYMTSFLVLRQTASEKGVNHEDMSCGYLVFCITGKNDINGCAIYPVCIMRE